LRPKLVKATSLALLLASNSLQALASETCTSLSSTSNIWHRTMTTQTVSDSVFRSRVIEMAVPAREQAEGRGARVRRSIGSAQLRNLDPFLMTDFFVVQPPGGFPDHPHRGMATVTYILPGSEGTIQHEDSAGHKGEIGAGDVQWMTAGRGIVHAEMPGNGKHANGIQLWVNLRKEDKMLPPEYQEIVSKDIPTAEKDGVSVRVIAGEALGVNAKIFTRTPTHYLHYTLAPGAVVDHAVPAHWNGFIYTIKGSGWVGAGAAEHAGPVRQPHHTLVFGKPEDSANTDGISAAAGDDGLEFVLIAGEPINEPIVQYGPFVMNSMPEIEQAFSDYRRGVNGFENAPVWVSEIRNKWQ